MKAKEVLEKRVERCVNKVYYCHGIKMCQLPKLLEAGVTLQGQIREGQGRQAGFPEGE